MLVLAPMRTLIETEAAIRLPLDIGQLTILLVAFAWLMHWVISGRRLLQFVWSPVYVPLGIFVAAGGLTLFTALSPGAWMNEWLKWLVIALLIGFVLMLQEWEWLVFGLVTAGVANALIGLYIFFGGSGALHLVVENRFFRAFGTFGQPNPFGGFMGLIAPVAGAAALGYTLRLWQDYRANSRFDAITLLQSVYYTVAFGLLSLGVIISWSRGAWLAFGISTVVLLVALPSKLWQSIFILTAILSITGILWTSGLLPNAIVDRINSASQELFAFDDVRGVDINPVNYAVVERLAHWQAALNMARSNLWLGVGFGNYEIAYETYRLINWEEPLGHAHNYYLNVFAETGMIGVVAYLSFWIYIILLTWSTRRHPDPLSRFIAAGLLGTWTYLSVHSLTDNLYVNNIFLHIGVMLGIISLLHYQVCQGVKLKRK